MPTSLEVVAGTPQRCISGNVGGGQQLNHLRPRAPRPVYEHVDSSTWRFIHHYNSAWRRSTPVGSKEGRRLNEMVVELGRQPHSNRFEPADRRRLLCGG